MLLLLFSGGSGLAIMSTRRIQLPVNCVLAGDQLYRHKYRVAEIFPTNTRERTKASVSGVSRLSKDKPSFSVKSTSKGYD